MNAVNFDKNTMDEDVTVGLKYTRPQNLIGPDIGGVDGIGQNSDGKVGNKRSINARKNRKRRQSNFRRRCFVRRCDQASFHSNNIRKFIIYFVSL